MWTFTQNDETKGVNKLVFNVNHVKNALRTKQTLIRGVAKQLTGGRFWGNIANNGFLAVRMSSSVVLNVVSGDFAPFAALRRTFGPVSAAPRSARSFPVQDSLCSALTRNIRCAQSCTESLNTTRLEISERKRSAFTAPPPSTRFTDENNKETKWTAGYHAPKTPPRSTQPQLLLSAVPLLAQPHSLFIRSFLSGPQLFFNGTCELFSSRETHAPHPLVKGAGGWLVVTSEELNSHVTFFLGCGGKRDHKTHGLICSELHLFVYVKHTINKWTKPPVCIFVVIKIGFLMYYKN